MSEFEIIAGQRHDIDRDPQATSASIEDIDRHPRDNCTVHHHARAVGNRREKARDRRSAEYRGCDQTAIDDRALAGGEIGGDHRSRNAKIGKRGVAEHVARRPRDLSTRKYRGPWPPRGVSYLVIATEKISHLPRAFGGARGVRDSQGSNPTHARTAYEIHRHVVSLQRFEYADMRETTRRPGTQRDTHLVESHMAREMVKIRIVPAVPCGIQRRTFQFGPG